MGGHGHQGNDGKGRAGQRLDTKVLSTQPTPSARRTKLCFTSRTSLRGFDSKRFHFSYTKKRVPKSFSPPGLFRHPGLLWGRGGWGQLTAFWLQLCTALQFTLPHFSHVHSFTLQKNRLSILNGDMNQHLVSSGCRPFLNDWTELIY